VSAKRKEEDEARRIAAADLIVEVCAEYSTAPGGMGIVGYAALEKRTGLRRDALLALRPLAEERARVLYPGCELVYDVHTQLWTLSDRPTQGQRKWAIGHAKSMVKQGRQGAKIGKMQNSKAADRLFGSMLDGQADQIEMILKFAEEEMAE
jgi:hypothetical protein